MASFAQVEAPAEEGHEGTGYAELGGAEASEGGGNTAELAAGADDDAMLPSGPALFGERPADRLVYFLVGSMSLFSLFVTYTHTHTQYH